MTPVVNAPAAQAVTTTKSIPAFGFSCISNKSEANCATGTNQFKAKVTEHSPTQVMFKFFNVGVDPSSITRIYFEDTDFKTLGAIAGIINSAGVNFSTTAPGNSNLPGGKSVDFQTTASVRAENPVRPSGVNNDPNAIGTPPSEFVAIVFDVLPGFSDPFNAVVTDLRRGTLRVGMHAQGFSDGGSESFVNGAVPEPITTVGSGIALGFGALMTRKRNLAKRKAAKA
ncbi:MAG: PEP-CTERM sorting domain-containing protein [Leptolyngbyaceae cyanobacterium SM1_1_3]|nr:PEP-CTERM sorting domain-containing protein [Leptolyngbyaceae cyanobacterium SM1_1_3]NJN03097.1 PEP-CTERM sorting domain-containing protein [Leptolyngbyaceae cyanobacterium RM1_1_2]NJO09598.1 PEP-CTERM sorting domain-containing protein [Leptolyngbyaceae cyanobacterium SL_1_1]